MGVHTVSRMMTYITGIACLCLTLVVLGTNATSTTVKVAKTLFPLTEAPPKNAYAPVVDGGDTWILLTPDIGNSVYLLDGNARQTTKCSYETKSYINKMKIKYKTKTRCQGIGSQERSSSSRDGSRCSSICAAAKALAHGYGHGSVNVWYQSKHTVC